MDADKVGHSPSSDPSRYLSVRTIAGFLVAAGLSVAAFPLGRALDWPYALSISSGSFLFFLVILLPVQPGQPKPKWVLRVTFAVIAALIGGLLHAYTFGNVS